MSRRKYTGQEHLTNVDVTESDFSVVWRKPVKKVRAATFLEERAANNLVTERLTIGNYREQHVPTSQIILSTHGNTRPSYRNPILTSEMETRIYRKLGTEPAETAEETTNKPGFPDQLCCSICLFPFIDPVMADPCSHVYCKACIMKWIQTKPDPDDSHPHQPSRRTDFQNCPICRCEIHLLRHAFEVRQKLFNCKGSCALWKQNDSQPGKPTDICDWIGNGAEYGTHIRKGCSTHMMFSMPTSEPGLGKRKSQSLESADEGSNNPKAPRKPKQKLSGLSFLESTQHLHHDPSSFGVSLGNALYSFSKKEVVISDEEAIVEVDLDGWEQAIHLRPN